MRQMNRFAAFALVLVGTCLSQSASAATFGFSCVTNNLAADCATGQAQFSVDVTDPGGSQVLFTFLNNGLNDSSITDIYFDDGALLGISSLVNTIGLVEFAVPAIPGELPGAGLLSPPFVTTAGFSADSDPPPSLLGVNPGESLGIFFDLIGGFDYSDVIAQLGDGNVRIGLRAQAFALGGSDSFVNIVPEPSTALLVSLGLFGLGLRRRSTHAAS